MFTKKCQCIVDPCCTMHLLRNEHSCVFMCVKEGGRGREREEGKEIR